MNHDAAVRKRITLSLLAGGKKKRPHRRSKSHADRIHLRANETHRVKNPHAGIDGTAGAVDVKLNVLVWIFAFQEEELRDHEAGARIVHFSRKENDAVAQKAREKIKAAFTATGIFEDNGYETHVTLPKIGFRNGRASWLLPLLIVYEGRVRIGRVR